MNQTNSTSSTAEVAATHLNMSYLTQLFRQHPCHRGDVVFDLSDTDAICWNKNISQQLSLRIPTPTDVSSLYPIEYAVPLFGYIMPLLFAITMVSNTLIIIVMSRRTMHTPTNKVLMSMAIADMLTLLIPAPWMIYLYTLGNYDKPLGSVDSCFMFVTMTDILPSLFHTASIWLTLVLAVQRYIYVCHAPMARFWCTQQRVVKSIVAVYLLALLHQLPRFFDRSFDTLDIYIGPGAADTSASCSIGRASWIEAIFGENVYYGCYFGFRVVFVHLLPCILLVILNILLFRTLKQAQAKRNQLFRKSMVQNRRECGRGMDTSCTTLMLIFVVSVFLIVEIPLAVVTTLHIAHNLIGTVQLLNYDVSQALVVIINFLIIVSYPINFAIYCGMSRQFRDTFADLFLGRLRQPTMLTADTRCHTANGQRRDETAL